jgi:hypothetical protein
MTNYFNNGLNIQVNGETIHITPEIIKEIHRQENIQWSKNILENYSDSIAKDINTITDNEFEEYAKALENEMMCDNGNIEYEVMERIFGVRT